MNKFVKFWRRMTGAESHVENFSTKAYDEFTAVEDPLDFEDFSVIKKREWDTDPNVQYLELDYDVSLFDCEELGRQYIAKELEASENRKKYEKVYYELCECLDLPIGVHIYHIDGDYWSIMKRMKAKICFDKDGNTILEEDGGFKYKDVGMTLNVEHYTDVFGEVPEFEENALNEKIREFIQLYKFKFNIGVIDEEVVKSYISYLYREERNSLSVYIERYSNNTPKRIEVRGKVILDGHILEFSMKMWSSGDLYSNISMKNIRKVNNLDKESE